MNVVRTIKLTPQMQVEALQQVLASQPRVLFLTDGQRRHIKRVTQDRFAALADLASRNGQRPDPV
jgi:hypothetical protein